MSSVPDSVVEETARIYRSFAHYQARDVSPIYEDWADGIAENPMLLARLANMPVDKRQPNLLFAAARHLGCTAVSAADLRPWLISHWDSVTTVMLSHATQTNEASRCATLLPALTQIPGPLALIEVGASEGLCLSPDRYSYDYRTSTGVVRVDPSGGPSSVVLPCTISGAPVPDSVPEVVWRAGLDLNPLDVTSESDMRWLESLIWPEHEARRRRLRAAAEIVAAEPPRIVTGDLLTDLDSLIAEAPAEATVVVFHSAVLAYVNAESRRRFADSMAAQPSMVWISNEGAGAFPEFDEPIAKQAKGRFVLTVDGTPVAYTGPHGQSFAGIPRTSSQPDDESE